MQCCGKLCYPTRSQANRAKGFMRGQRRRNDAVMHVYRCPMKNGWHLASRLQTQQTRRYKFTRAMERQDLQFAEAL